MTGEPWFAGEHAGLIGGIGGSVIGLMGGVLGSLCGWLVPRGRGRRVVLGILAGMCAFGVGCLITAGVAWATGQPYHVWYVFLLPGVLTAVLGGVLSAVMRRRYVEVELRKMHASEMR